MKPWTRCQHPRDLITRTAGNGTTCTGCGWTHPAPPESLAATVAILGLYGAAIAHAIADGIETIATVIRPGDRTSGVIASMNRVEPIDQDPAELIRDTLARLDRPNRPTRTTGPHAYFEWNIDDPSSLARLTHPSIRAGQPIDFPFAQHPTTIRLDGIDG